MHKGFFFNNEKNNYIKEYLEEKLLEYGKMNYAYLVINKSNLDEIMVISDLNDYFKNTYLRKKFQNVDPVIINALNRFSLLAWDEKLVVNSQWNNSKCCQKSWGYILKSVTPYNIISGQTFVLHDNNGNLALLSLYINKFLMADIYDNVKKNKDQLQGLLINIHEM
ncbi:LuxR family quorum-sensing system transcriptional regulator ExpR [Erwinia toletana]|uniref:LuxR family quorum-sensing system transcriptional regulator ExpR n=1 Tax=Winslowiella toletana TaxID=92490 RepID=A0ABS4PCR7_9GAMM|nr:LuxR family quorum-sensing system transcriptional regulator ExpR [Winslowiella toletana]